MVEPVVVPKLTNSDPDYLIIPVKLISPDTSAVYPGVA